MWSYFGAKLRIVKEYPKPMFGNVIECCATHDHCDANMLMDEAYTEIVGHEIDLQNQDETQLWSNAWDLSKGNNFSI